MTTLPMFPLGTVVFPGERLPLRVFEPRYRQLVLDCLAADSPVFGTTLIERGSEVGGGDERASVGTVMVLRAVEPIDGRGRRRGRARGGPRHVRSFAVRRTTCREDHRRQRGQRAAERDRRRAMFPSRGVAVRRDHTHDMSGRPVGRRLLE